MIKNVNATHILIINWNHIRACHKFSNFLFLIPSLNIKTRRRQIFIVEKATNHLRKERTKRETGVKNKVFCDNEICRSGLNTHKCVAIIKFDFANCKNKSDSNSLNYSICQLLPNRFQHSNRLLWFSTSCGERRTEEQSCLFDKQKMFTFFLVSSFLSVLLKQGKLGIKIFFKTYTIVWYRSPARKNNSTLGYDFLKKEYANPHKSNR